MGDMLKQSKKQYEVIKLTGRRAVSMTSDVSAYEVLSPNASEGEVLLIYDGETETFSIYDHDCFEQDVREMRENRKVSE